MIKIDSVSLKRAASKVNYNTFEPYLKLREVTYKSRFFGITRTKKMTMFHKDFVDYCNGKASSEFYIFMIQNFLTANDQEPIEIEDDRIEKAKDAVRRQWVHTCGGDFAKDHCVHIANFLIYQAVLRGYFEEKYEPTRNIG